MKKLSIVFTIIIIIVIGAYLYIRFVVLKAKDFEPDYSKSKSVVDLRPALIAKLQQLVKDASAGLYDLSIGKIDPHISDLSIDITHAVLIPDSVIINRLNKSHLLPDNVFKISLSSLHIDGIHINDLLSKDHLSLLHILINSPVIEVYYREKWHNKPLHISDDSITVYKGIMKKMKSISINTIEVKNGTAHGFQLHPRFNKLQFESHLHARKEMYNLSIPKIILHGISWSELTNYKNIIANSAVVSNGSCKIFLDRSLPFRHVKINNFPQQILMRIPVAISIAQMHIRECNLAYSEHNPGMNKTGTIYIDHLKGEITNITNMPEQIKKQNLLVIKSSGLFMHKIPMTNGFVFDLSKYKTGNFRMDLNIGELDSSVLNPITAPMGEFMIKKGRIQVGIAHVTGDNFKATGKGELLYKNLYLIGLKKDKSKPSGIKKKSLISFLGNVFLIKNNNPEKGEEPRIVDFYFKRENKTTFFSLVWGTIYLGILKTIGLPQRFADKSY